VNEKYKLPGKPYPDVFPVKSSLVFFATVHILQSVKFNPTKREKQKRPYSETFSSDCPAFLVSRILFFHGLRTTVFSRLRGFFLTGLSLTGVGIGKMLI